MAAMLPLAVNAQQKPPAGGPAAPASSPQAPTVLDAAKRDRTLAEYKRLKGVGHEFDVMLAKGDAVAGEIVCKLGFVAYEDKPVDLSVALHRCGEYFFEHKNIDLARDYLLEADKLLTEAAGKDHPYRAQILQSLSAYHALGKAHKKARASFSEAHAIITKYAHTWSADGLDMRHLQSGAAVPVAAGRAQRTGTHAFNIEGTDVTAAYAAPGHKITLYFTRYDQPVAVKQAYRQTFKAMQRRVPEPEVITERQVEAQAGGMPDNGLLGAIEYDDPSGKRIRDAVYLFGKADWIIKVRYTHLAALEQDARNNMRSLFSKLTWPSEN